MKLSILSVIFLNAAMEFNGFAALAAAGELRNGRYLRGFQHQRIMQEELEYDCDSSQGCTCSGEGYDVYRSPKECIRVEATSKVKISGYDLESLVNTVAYAQCSDENYTMEPIDCNFCEDQVSITGGLIQTHQFVSDYLSNGWSFNDREEQERKTSWCIKLNEYNNEYVFAVNDENKQCNTNEHHYEITSQKIIGESIYHLNFQDCQGNNPEVLIDSFKGIWKKVAINGALSEEYTSSISSRMQNSVGEETKQVFSLSADVSFEGSPITLKPSLSEEITHTVTTAFAQESSATFKVTCENRCDPTDLVYQYRKRAENKVDPSIFFEVPTCFFQCVKQGAEDFHMVPRCPVGYCIPGTSCQCCTNLDWVEDSSEPGLPPVCGTEEDNVFVEDTNEENIVEDYWY